MTSANWLPPCKGRFGAGVQKKTTACLPIGMAVLT
jgi:hypothetical protein